MRSLIEYNIDEPSDVAELFVTGVKTVITPPIRKITELCYSNPNALAGIKILLDPHSNLVSAVIPMIDQETGDDLGSFMDKPEHLQKEHLTELQSLTTKDLRWMHIKGYEYLQDHITQLWNIQVINIINLYVPARFLQRTSMSKEPVIELIGHGEPSGIYRYKEIEEPILELYKEE